MVQLGTRSLHTSDVLTSPANAGKLASVSADSDTPVDRSACVQPCVTLCLRSVWQVETETCFRWPMCRGVAPPGERRRGTILQMSFLDVAPGATTRHTEPST